MTIAKLIEWAQKHPLQYKVVIGKPGTGLTNHHELTFEEMGVIYPRQNNNNNEEKDIFDD